MPCREWCAYIFEFYILLCYTSLIYYSDAADTMITILTSMLNRCCGNHISINKEFHTPFGFCFNIKEYSYLHLNCLATILIIYWYFCHCESNLFNAWGALYRSLFVLSLALNYSSWHVVILLLRLCSTYSRNELVNLLFFLLQVWLFWLWTVIWKGWNCFSQILRLFLFL